MFAACLIAGPLRAEKAEIRTFTSTKGAEIKAALISSTDTHAELKREDGKKFTVPLNTLSEADRAWIAEWRKTHKHYKVQVLASIKKGNTREEKEGAFGGKPLKGNDCWYALTFKNSSGEPLTGLRVEYIIFSPAEGTASSLCGSCEVADIPAGKNGEAATQKLFVSQARTVIRSGNTSAVQFSESSLTGLRAELLVDGKPAGVFISGKVPDDAEEQLKTWREKQKAPKEETPAAKP